VADTWFPFAAVNLLSCSSESLTPKAFQRSSISLLGLNGVDKNITPTVDVMMSL